MMTTLSRWWLVAMLGSVVAAAARAQDYYGEEEAGLAPGQQYSSFAVGDLDGDRRPDVFVGTLTSNLGDDEVWLRPGGGAWRPKWSAGLVRGPSAQGGADTHAVFLVDWDRDGDLDVLRKFYSWSKGDEIQILWNDGKAGFSTGPTLPGSGRATSHYVTLGDVDGDGDLDVATGGATGPLLWINLGKGVFKEKRLPTHKNSAPYSGVHMVDIDGDLRLDLFLTVLPLGGTWPPGPILYANRPQGWVDVTAQSGLPATLAGWSMLVQDLDRDGDVDVAVAAVGNKKIRLFENRGKGRFRERLAGLFPGVKGVGFRVFPLRFARFGVQPVLLRYYPDGQNPKLTAWLPGAGFAMKALPQSAWLPKDQGSFGTFDPSGYADWDGDGDLDLIYRSANTGKLVLRRSLDQELRVGPARLGRSWQLEALHLPGRLPRGGLALMALAPRLGTQVLRLPGLGLWALPLTGWQNLGARSLPAPGGTVGWTLAIPAQPGLLGQTYAVQAAVWDPARRWALTRAVSGRVMR